MTTKYFASQNQKQVRIVEIVRETKYFVRLQSGKLVARESRLGVYCDSFEEAKKFLTLEAERKVWVLRRKLEAANQDIARIKRMKDPLQSNEAK
jgi:ribosomal protein L16/L10AE